MSEWPVRWTKPMFKTPVSQKVVRIKKRMARATVERNVMQEARKRDKRCRFPLCGCRTYGLRTEVAHERHRGMGGNPALDRTTTGGLILVCSARHKENRLSLDGGTIRWSALTAAGADGPVVWFVDLVALGALHGVKGPVWREVARETAVRQWEPFRPDQLSILTTLSGMLL